MLGFFLPNDFVRRIKAIVRPSQAAGEYIKECGRVIGWMIWNSKVPQRIRVFLWHNHHARFNCP
ncbi:hypothetical protein GLYMA_20G077250v4 [Glycine max]|nr:hypothetical protein GLYMA_20G077250v4 [Glycine max]KAH1035055.1 hypothetical protein GYH30_055156 [Glycine max]